MLTLHSNNKSPGDLGGVGCSNNTQRPETARRRWSDQKEDKSAQGVDRLDEKELRVLYTTSRINTRTYVPFIRECDLKEPFALSIPFS